MINAMSINTIYNFNDDNPWPPSFSLEQVYEDTLGRPGSVVVSYDPISS